MKTSAIPPTGTLLAIVGLTCWAPDSARPSEPADFPETKDLFEAMRESGLESVWRVDQGTWEFEGGVLRGRPQGAEEALATVRCPLGSGDLEFTVRFRLLGDARAFHLTFKPDEKLTGKEGFLFSVVVARNATKIVRHRDRSLPGDQNRAVAAVFHPVEEGAWHELKIRSVGEEVSVTLEGAKPIHASDPEFALGKASFFLRVAGGEMEIERLVLGVPASEAAEE